MSTKKDSAAHKAAIAVKQSKAVETSVVHKDHKSKGLKAAIKKMLAQWASLVVTTATFAGLLFITLACDKYVLHYLFTDFAVGTDPWLGYFFKAGKYAAVITELAFFVHGVYLDCKHHEDE